MIPITAMGVTYDPGTGHSVGEDLSLTGLNAGESIIIQSGNGIRVLTGGITLAGNMYIGLDDQGSATGQLYAESTIDPSFTIVSDGLINVVGALNVYSGKDFGIHSGSGLIDASFGSISNNGTINIYNIDNFDVAGTTLSSGNFSISAAQIEMGSIISSAGNMNLNSSGNITISDFTNDSTGTANFTANNLYVSNLQNNTGVTNITLTGDLSSTGDIENSGDGLNIISASIININGTVKNDNASGVMTVNSSDFRVTGGDALNASFVNSGDFIADISHTARFEYGIDLSTMNTYNEFNLQASVLEFGTGVTADSILQFFSNKLDSYTLITGSIINANDITNGSGGNVNANMILTGSSINAASVNNYGNELNMTSTSTYGGIYLTSGITNDSTISMISDNDINIAGNVDNDGDLTLNGLSINLNSIVNTGSIYIPSSPVVGSLTVASNITNQGGMIDIDSSDIDIGGVITNIGGNISVIGSNSIAIGGIDSQLGILTIDSLMGSVSIDNDISVTSGGLNFSAGTNTVSVGGNVNISGNLTASSVQAIGSGDVNAANAGVQAFLMESAGGNINIGGSVSAIENDLSRTIVLDADVIDITGSAIASNRGSLIFGNGITTNLYIDGDVNSTVGGLIDINSINAEIGSLYGNGKFIARGSIIRATAALDNVINLENGILFDGSDPLYGFVIRDTNDLTLETTAAGADIFVDGGISVGSGNKLTLDSIDEINLSGLITVDGELDLASDNITNINDEIVNTGIMNIDALTIATTDITNSGTIVIDTDSDIYIDNIINSGDITLSTVDSVVVNTVSSTAGGLDITADYINFTSLSVTGGYTNLNTTNFNVIGDVSVTGDFVQGGTTGMLNFTQHNATFDADNLTIGGDFSALQYTASYNLLSDLNITGILNTASSANVDFTATSILLGGIDNAGNLIFNSNDVDLGDVQTSGYLEINTDDITYVNSLTTIGTGGVEITGTELDSTGAVTLAGGLLQNAAITPADGSLNILASDFIINASNIDVAVIDQTSGTLLLNTSDLNVSGDINVDDLSIVANGTDWLTMNVDGNINGNVDIIGLERLVVGGDYLFDDNSMLHAAILPRATAPHNYWSTVSLLEDDTLGQITNGVAGEPLISINGEFISDLSVLGSGAVGALEDTQIGIDLFDIVDQGTAIWFLHADDGIEELGLKTRNLYVKFCNADGSICYNYLDSLGVGSTDEDDLPAYISVRDTDGDGDPDSLYVVFDPRFGGPVEVFKIQPIVDREDYHTYGEYAAAGALDNLISGRMEDLGFFNRNPIETIPVVFQDTYMEEVATELYDRMEQYQLDHDGSYLARFSRLFQPTEIDQLAGTISLNEHTSFRDFEDHAFDEFIWNRNRKLKKSWLDMDFGMFNQTVGTENKASGDRFSIYGGFDWKESETLLMGLTGRITRMSDSSVDKIDLSYRLAEPVSGRVDVDVSNTNIGIGGYLMKILSEGTRAYGNAFIDVSMLDVSREQTFVEDQISGTGTSFSLISEWGLMHDILNQYIVGNLYSRAGYSSGFTINEKSGSNEYMNLQSDGYFILTPGYSLIAQKKIYTSPWFQIRPSISIGAEYDLIGMPNAQFKFAMANDYEDYKVDIDPLWANAGAGIEFLSANGMQFGIDYRYQYNADMQMHKIRLSGSYRF